MTGARSVLDLVGDTPLVDLSALSPKPSVRILAKLEGQNPTGSVKDRIAVAMVEAAEAEGTGPEIWRDCPDITHFVSGLGTSGTLMGVGRYLKEQNPAVQVWAVEPPAGEQVQGLRSLDEGFVPPVFDPDVLDRKLIVRPKESVEWLRRLNEEAGLLAGISSGAAMAGAAKATEQIDEGVVVTLFADGGGKYLSTGVWTDPLDEVVERLKSTVYF